MFDLGWQEFLLVAVVTVMVVGPKDLPRVIRTVSQWVRKARSMAREFQSSLEEVAREAELDDVRKQVQSIQKDGISKSIEREVDPDGSIRGSLDEARKSTGVDEIEGELREIDAAAKSPEPKSPQPEPTETKSPEPTKPADPGIETAADYAAKTVSGDSGTPADADTEPAKPKAAAGGSSGDA